MSKEIDRPAIEGTIVEPKVRAIRVKELIEKLQQFDPELYVVTKDCCYGYDWESDPYVDSVGKYCNWEAGELGLKSGDKFVVID